MLVRGFVIGVSQTLAEFVWVAWIHKVVFFGGGEGGGSKIIAGVEILV